MLVKTSHVLSIRFDILTRADAGSDLIICGVFPPLKLERESTPWQRVEKVWATRLNRDPRENHLERSVAFGEQERVVGGIDNSGQRCTAFLAIEPIAFKAARIDIGICAAVEIQPRMALRTLRTIARRGVAR